MKKFITPAQCETLVHALIFSLLDYCNSLYYGITSSNMQHLQSIQNRACRIVLGLKKHAPVDEMIKKLHWLKIQERIEFKLILLTFKCLHGLAPTYLTDLIHYNNLSGSRTPSLKVPFGISSIGERAFESCAPRLWNGLPTNLKQCQKLQTFKALLKTFLFRKSFNVCS